MTTAKTGAYKTVLLCEATRFFEQQTSQDANYAETVARKQGGSFEQRLATRALHLDSAINLEADLDNILYRQKMVQLALSVLFFILGYVISTGLLLSQNDQGTNVYLLMGALLLPNLFSMGIFIFFALNKQSIPRFNIFEYLSSLLFKNKQQLARTSAQQAWQSVSFSQPLAKWWLGTWSHFFWLAFLSGSLLAMLIRFSAHQYFLGWESTLLPEAFFVDISTFFSWPMTLLGFDVPTLEQVISSNLKEGFYPDNAIAKKWAIFLLLSIVLYAMLPRAILWFVAFIAYQASKQQLSIDTSLTEYAQLYQPLMLYPQNQGIVDPDTQAVVQQTDVDPLEMSLAIHELAPELPFLALELSKPLPEAVMQLPNFLGAITSRADKQRLVNDITQQQLNQAVVLLSLLQVPDRGIVRLIEEVIGLFETTYIVFINQSEAQSTLSAAMFSQRLLDWRNTLKSISVDLAQAGLADINDSVVLKALGVKL